MPFWGQLTHATELIQPEPPTQVRTIIILSLWWRYEPRLLLLTDIVALYASRTTKRPEI